MSIIERMRKQRAVYWPVSGWDRYGNATHGTAVEIACRWEDVQETVIDRNGTEKLSMSRVYVDREMEGGAFLFEGELTDLTDVSDPRANSGAVEVLAFNRIPNIRATEFLLWANVA